VHQTAGAAGADLAGDAGPQDDRGLARVEAGGPRTGRADQTEVARAVGRACHGTAGLRPDVWPAPAGRGQQPPRELGVSGDERRGG
ncbi:MAG: hypothetical protein RMJ55_19690, partial [Roseiflexaceae bacterium]|nr:hypothetical protein [Roseiflexaceae bacterium]